MILWAVSNMAGDRAALNRIPRDKTAWHRAA